MSAKYKAYFLFRSIKSYSVIPLFRYSVVPLFRIQRFTDSPSFTLYTVHRARGGFFRTPTQIQSGKCTSRFDFAAESALPALNLQRKVHLPPRKGVSVITGLHGLDWTGLDWTGILKFVFTLRGMQLKSNHIRV